MACFNVREATERDCDDIMTMIKELAVYEKMLEEVAIDAEDLRRDGFGEKQFFHAFVAELTTEGSDGKRPLVGYVMYYYTYNPWYGKTCTLEDFYVAEQWRKKGIGSTLWARVCQTALSMGCSKLSWVVVTWNKLAIDFYKVRGGHDMTEQEGWLLYRMEKDAMKNLVAKTLPNE